MTKITKIIMLAACLFTASAFAEPQPMVIMKQVATEMTGELNKNITQLKTNDAIVYKIVDKTLLPHFDLNGMARAVVGRDAWQKATQAQHQQFIKEFTHYVVKTYAAALSSYDGEVIKFYPLREDVGAKTRVQIDSDLIHKSGPSIHMQYRLIKTGNTWLIYDFSIDGISLARNHQEQFAPTIRQGGLAKLIEQLKQNNQN